MKTREKEYKRWRTEACTKMLKILFLIGGAAIVTDSIANRTRTYTLVYRIGHRYTDTSAPIHYTVYRTPEWATYIVYTIYTVCRPYGSYGSVFGSFTKFWRYMQYTDTVYCIYRLHRYIIIPYTVCRYGLCIVYTVYGMLVWTTYTVYRIRYIYCTYRLYAGMPSMRFSIVLPNFDNSVNLLNFSNLLIQPTLTGMT